MPLTITTNLGTGLRTVGMVTVDADGNVTIRCISAEWAGAIRREIESGVTVEIRAPRAPGGDRHAKSSE